jgi:AmpD protein
MKQANAPKPAPLWVDGWYQFASPVESPNFGPRPPGCKPELIVVHAISLPPGCYGGKEVEQLFTNQLDWEQHPYFETIRDMTVSAHFYIRRRGELKQFVSTDDRAWHAGVSSYRGRSNCNDYSIGIELEGADGAPFEDEQYETLAALCAAILERYQMADLAGHEHVAPGRKTDPGAGFGWRRLQKSLGLTCEQLPEGIGE